MKSLIITLHLLVPFAGTPIQNNMKELWALFDWATNGKVLGTQKRFLNQYAIAIEDGRSKDATKHTLRIAEKANKDLQEKIRPHFLQRMKNAEFKDCLPVKKELVVWAHLSNTQREMYESYVVDGGKVAAILSGEMSSPLEAITWLKKLCDHPSLVNKEIEHRSLDNDVLRRSSAKLNILIHLVRRLNKSKHRCLIFSPSTKMLDIIQMVLPLKLGRIDGSTKGKDRQSIVDNFNKKDSKFDALLLSTKAAGVGLTLTGADRAIIFSPSWNPADDSQAVDRCAKLLILFCIILVASVFHSNQFSQMLQDWPTE
jgi:SNF2 family DNA or RNA helicase